LHHGVIKMHSLSTFLDSLSRVVAVKKLRAGSMVSSSSRLYRKLVLFSMIKLKK
jgi:hypothetical protein